MTNIVGAVLAKLGNRGNKLKYDKIAFAIPLLFLAQVSSADDELRAEMSRCAALIDTSDRLACYDQISFEKIKVPETPLSPAVASAPAAVPVDQMSAQSPAQEKPQKEQPKTMNAHVIRCTKDARKKYLFYLEGGEVWKQISDKRLSYKECDFNVTISKDFFGHKMQVAGEKSRTRVSRVR